MCYMADDETRGKPMMRPSGLCSAAYYGDVKVIKKLLFIEPVEEDPPLDAEFDPSVPADPELAAGSKERAAKRQANEVELLRRVNQPDLITVRKTPVDLKRYGFGLKVRETDDASRMATLQFKPSSKYMHKAPPLHWAVLGKEHAAVALLVENGADIEALTPDYRISVNAIVERNDLKETAYILKTSKLARDVTEAAKTAKVAAFDAELRRRELARVAFAEEEKRKADDEKRAADDAERAAAAEAVAGGEAGGEE